MVGGVSAAFQQKDPYPRTRPEIDAYPYAQMGVRLGKLQRGIVVLVAVDGPRERWISADGLVVQMDYGRASLLSGPDFQGQLVELAPHDPIRNFITSGEVNTAPYQKSIAQGVAPTITQIVYDCAIRISADQTVTIVEDEIESTVLIETCSTAESGAIENTFWVSKERPYVWKSFQTMGGNTPSVTLEVLKRPS